MIKEESLSDMVKTSLVNMEENGVIICEDGGYSLSRRFIAIMRKRGLDDDDIEFAMVSMLDIRKNFTKSIVAGIVVE